MHADDENISEFLKMLDTSKDLMTRSAANVSLEESARNATAPAAALARFRGLIGPHAALSDSMTSSMHIHRSSTSSSKQLSGVPPMVAGTSISTASSPGKPISPHTPHTPAIRSRLSSNSVADDIVIDHERQRAANIEHDPALDEHPGLEATQHSSTAAAIDIPTSPRVFDPSYRRSSSAAQHRRHTVSDDDEIFPFGMRSMSVGPQLPLPVGPQQETEFVPDNQSGQQSLSENAPTTATSSTGPYRDATSARGTGPTATSVSSTTNVYQPRFASSRGRGFSGGPQSLSSASSSLARGANIPPHLVERDADRDGNASGSNSGNSTTEIRRGSGHRPTTSRAPPSQIEDDEPLLFAMSDFGASRRSLEETRGNHGGSDSAGGSRRGSGRRGAGLPSFHPWS
jgi:autophagy-related protein 13